MKNVLKWLYVSYLISNKNEYLLLVVLLIFPLVKFIVIGIGNIIKFRRISKNIAIIFIFSTIILIESCFEIPSHCIFPENHIYLHTNYFKIYDLCKFKQIEIASEIFENFIILISLFFCFTSGNIGIIPILTLTFSFMAIAYYLTAEVYFMFYIEQAVEVNVLRDEYGRKIKRLINEDTREINKKNKKTINEWIGFERKDKINEEAENENDIDNRVGEVNELRDEYGRTIKRLNTEDNRDTNNKNKKITKERIGIEKKNEENDSEDFNDIQIKLGKYLNISNSEAKNGDINSNKLSSVYPSDKFNN